MSRRARGWKPGDLVGVVQLKRGGQTTGRHDPDVAQSFIPVSVQGFRRRSSYKGSSLATRRQRYFSCLGHRTATGIAGRPAGQGL